MSEMYLPRQWFLLLLIATAIRVTYTSVDFKPRCDKIDQCSCKLRNVRHPGVINLHSLVDGELDGEHQPRFINLGSESPMAPTTKYNYFYNPCDNFTVPKGNYDYCENAAVCQTVIGDYYYSAFNLGTIESVQFLYENNTVVAVYQSGDRYYANRTTKVELVCDPNQVLGKLVFVEEQPIRKTLYKMCMSWGMCVNSEGMCYEGFVQL